MNRFLQTAIAIPLLAAATPALAGSDGQYWQTLNIGVNLPNNFKVTNETVLRSSDARGFYEVENSLLVGKKLNKKVTAFVGYVFNPQYNHGTFITREHRFRQQVTVDNFAQLGSVKLSGRMRLEQRWRENAPGTAWRLRPYVKASMPLAGKTTLSFTNEAFIDLNTNSFQKVPGLERMRTAAMIGVPISKQFSFDFGYLNQHSFVPNAPDNDDHTFAVQLNASF